MLPERREALIAGHLNARRAIRAVSPPGAIWSRLAQLDERRWVEVVAWESRPVFERAAELAPNDPTARAWFDLAEPGWTIVIGEFAEEPDSPPPREGELELVWSAVPEGEPPAAANGAAWAVFAETDRRTLVEHSGWVEGQPSLVRITVSDPGEAGGRAERGGEREAGPIEHAIDEAEEREPT